VLRVTHRPSPRLAKKNDELPLNLDLMYRMDENAANVDLAMIDPPLAAPLEATDESLIEAARAGDDSAFEQIFKRHRRRVARMVGRFFNRPEKVDEILQEVFTKVYFALGTYSSERGPSFAAWLSRVAINSCYDELRRARRRPESSISDITSDEVVWLNARLGTGSTGRDAESQVISRDLANKLLARLSADDRLVLTLLDGEELTVAEIAVLMGWKISKVKVRAHRARQSLRKVLGEFV
jgi:RNA polymerase sigma-70 factor, ECF subfamily